MRKSHASHRIARPMSQFENIWMLFRKDNPQSFAKLLWHPRITDFLVGADKTIVFYRDCYQGRRLVSVKLENLSSSFLKRCCFSFYLMLQGVCAFTRKKKHSFYPTKKSVTIWLASNKSKFCIYHCSIEKGPRVHQFSPIYNLFSTRRIHSFLF